MASVVETLQLAGGQVPTREDQFWSELAAFLNLAPKSKDLSRVAQAVLDALDVEWDDEFSDESGGLTLALYETLEDAVKHYDAAREAGQPLEEEEDDDESVRGIRDERVAPVVYGLATVHQWIHDGLLVLSPEWQRDFVWKSKKMKRFIESILLGLPIPSFLIFEDSGGRKYVIDGRQRLETIARFKAEKEEKGSDRVRFRTFPKSEPGWGPGEPLGNAAGKYYAQLEQVFKTRIDSAHLVVAEFRNISLANLYQVFKRYNTGAVALNAAEIRNAVYQASPLHQMMFRLAGEIRPRQHLDDEELRVADDLRETMQRKVQRYGAYDFVGRYFAFAYQERGSVAKATLDFMDAYAESATARIEELRQEFIRVFRTSQEWYPEFLTDPEGDRFHAFLATLQLVSTKFILQHVDAGRVTPERVQASISQNWNGFAENRLTRKQNSTLFWGSQRTWLSMLEAGLELVRKYDSWDWKADLETPRDGAV